MAEGRLGPLRSQPSVEDDQESPEDALEEPDDTQPF
jgi:hypothetical protein